LEALRLIIGPTTPGAFRDGLIALLVGEPDIELLKVDDRAELRGAIEHFRPNALLVGAECDGEGAGLRAAELEALLDAFHGLVVVTIDRGGLDIIVRRPQLGLVTLIGSIRALLAEGPRTGWEPAGRLVAFDHRTLASGDDSLHGEHLSLLASWVEAVLAVRLAEEAAAMPDTSTGAAGWGLSFERALALLGHGEGCPTRDAARARREEAERALAVFERRAAEQGQILPVVAFERALALSDLESRALRLVVGGELDERFGRVFGFLNDDMTRRRPTLALLGAVLFDERSAVRQVRDLIAGHGNLARYGALQIEPSDWPSAHPLPAQAIAAPADVLGVMIDGAFAPSVAGGGLSLHPPATLLEAVERGGSSRELSEGLRAVLARPADSVPVLQLRNGLATRGWLLDTLSRYGVASVVFDPASHHSPDGQPIEQTVLAAARTARLHDAALVIVPPASTVPSDSGQVVRTIVRQLHGLVRLLVVESKEAWHVAGDDALPACWLIDRNPPEVAERAALWRQAAAAHQLELTEDDARELGAVLRFDRPDAEASLRLAVGSGKVRNDRVTLEELRAASRRIAAARAPSMVRAIEPAYRWPDIALPDAVLEELREIPNHLRHSGTVLEEWKFAQRVPYGRAVTALFSGASGTGKTMAAQIIAAELGVILYHVDLSQTVSKYIGETEKQLDRVFSEAEAASACVVFDECEAIFGKRTEVKDAHDRYANLESAFLLQRLESFRGCAILTTNLKQNLDPAFVRRLRFVVDFPAPDAAQREIIWGKAFPDAAQLADDVDIRFLARRFDLTGGHIQQVAIRAAFLAAADGERIHMRHVTRATRYELAKLGMLQAERRLAARDLEPQPKPLSA
jgi:hypothetical protein